MPLMIPTGFASAAFEFNGPFGTAPYITTLGVDVSDFGGDFVDAADLLHNAWATTVLTRQSTDVTLVKVILAVGQDGSGAGVESTVPSSAGGANMDDAPVSMAMIARKVSATPGKPGKGRMFIPFSVQKDQLLPGRADVQDQWRNALQAQLDAFKAILDSGTFAGSSGPPCPAVILHSGAGAPSPVLAFVAATRCGWVRGRL